MLEHVHSAGFGPLKELVDSFLELGGRLLVCVPCIQERKIDVKDLIDKGLIAPPPYFQLCMGVKWGVGGEIEDLLFMKSKLPENALWSVLGVQKTQLPMITMSMLLGGHVRVGFEDNLYLKKGVLFRNNAEAVEVAANLAENLGRSVASPTEARNILGIV